MVITNHQFMEMISLAPNNLLIDDSAERIIKILTIALVTITSLLAVSLYKAHKLRVNIKQLENK